MLKSNGCRSRWKGPALAVAALWILADAGAAFAQDTPTPTPTYDWCPPEVLLAPNSGPPGTGFSLSGRCYFIHSGQTANVYFDATPIGTVRGDTLGNYGGDFLVPASASPGAASVQVMTSSELGAATFEVTGATPSITDTATPTSTSTPTPSPTPSESDTATPFAQDTPTATPTPSESDTATPTTTLAPPSLPAIPPPAQGGWWLWLLPPLAMTARRRVAPRTQAERP